jgi:hypothetical protein
VNGIGPRPARSHAALDHAFDFLNRGLFDGLLPPCLITLQRTRRAFGYFSGDRFITIDDSTEVTDEIALNPIHFASQLTTNVLATLAHEMVHLWQHRSGTPSRGGYHNREWARKMVEIGLIPSSTGAPGGKPTGGSVSHYIEPGGRFQLACADYLASNSIVLFQDRTYRDLPMVSPPDDGSQEVDGGGRGVGVRVERIERERRRKAASKTRFTCSRCGQNAWGNRGLQLLCGNDDCDQERMLP